MARRVGEGSVGERGEDTMTSHASKHHGNNHGLGTCSGPLALRSAWLLLGFAFLLPPVALAQQNPVPIVKPGGSEQQLFGKERAGGYQGFTNAKNELDYGIPDPSTNVSRKYMIKPSHQKVDPMTIDNYLKNLEGLPEGKIEESEIEDIIDGFESRYGVVVQDRDVLATSSLTREGLGEAFKKSLLDKNTDSWHDKNMIKTPSGRVLSFTELPPFEKQAILVFVNLNGRLPPAYSLVPPALYRVDKRWGGKTSYGTVNGDRSMYYPNGNQKTIGMDRSGRSRIWLTYPYQTRYSNSYLQRNLNDRSKTDETDQKDELWKTLRKVNSRNEMDFYKDGPRIHHLDDSFAQFYSNGRPKYDNAGNELYPNGARKRSDSGLELYSNGQRRFDNKGNELHSNGRRKTTDDLRPLYASGKAKLSKTGAELYRRGTPKWSGDGVSPGKYQDDGELDFDERLCGVYERNGGWGVDSASGLVDATADNRPGERSKVRQVTQNRELYPNGREQRTSTGKKLYPNGKAQFSGDGIGNSPYQDGLRFETQDKRSFVAPLYPNGRRQFEENTNRLYSDGKRRSAENGEFLYPNGHRLANTTNRAITPEGDAVNATYGFQGRAQGTFPIFEIVTGTIVAKTGEKLILKTKGSLDETEIPLGSPSVARVGVEPIPGDLAQLSAKLNVQAIVKSNSQFVDGELVESGKEPRLVAVLATNPKVGLKNIPDGRQTVISLLTGSPKTISEGKLYFEVGKDQIEEIAVSDGILVQRTKKGVVTPAPFRSIAMGKRADLVLSQDYIYKDGKIVQRLEPHALAILEK